MDHPHKISIAGALGGAVNGIFGGGGGMILLPLLTRWSDLDDKKLFATSVAIILPICVVSTAVYFTQTELSLSAALPYLIGGTAGGWAGGRWFKGMKMPWLKRAFGLLLIYGGVRSFL